MKLIRKNYYCKIYKPILRIYSKAKSDNANFCKNFNRENNYVGSGIF